MKRIKLHLFVFAVLLSSFACNKDIQITFQNSEKNSIFEYTKSELNLFFDKGKLSLAQDEGIENIEFVFQVNPELEEAAFEISSQFTENKLKVNLSGQSPSDVLYAAYTFLEKGGWLFEITGPIQPEYFNWNALKNYNEKIVAAVKKRGIRQHINFTMDVSAWPLDEAKSYMQNLARMRFNYMTFHSYQGQWYEVARKTTYQGSRNDSELNKPWYDYTQKDTVEYAGHFFYGDVHLVPNQKDIKAIVKNEKYFCIPEIEDVFEDKAKRSEKSIAWLRAVMSEAKKVGMQVQFSLEPRNVSANIEKSVETVQAIIQDYPMINALEFITDEAGGWGPRTTEEFTKEVIVSHFGEEYLSDSIVMKPVKKEQSDLAFIYGQMGHNIKLIKYLQKHKEIVPENIDLKIGIYVAIPEYAKPSFYLARKFAPETEIAIMPGHHSLRVKNNMPKVLRTTEDWDKSIIYSWIEFDGMMYIQQNGISGIEDIVNQAVENTSDHRANTILYNHWRTAENKITARYAAESGVSGGIPPLGFYKNYAKSYGIEYPENFARAMELLDKADLSSIENVGGFAFCWVGRWRNGGPVSNYPEEKTAEVKLAYERVLEQLKPCSEATNSKNGRVLLAFLDNRIRTTIIYIKAFEKARELVQFNDKRDSLSVKDKEEYVRICNESLALFDQYINIYAQINADRGCAGNLVSLWHGPVKGIKVLRQKYGGVAFEEEIPLETAVDEPPLPIIKLD